MCAADFHEVGRRGIRLIPSIDHHRWDERIADFKSEDFQTDPQPKISYGSIRTKVALDFESRATGFHRAG